MALDNFGDPSVWTHLWLTHLLLSRVSPACSALQHGDGSGGRCFGLWWPRASSQPLPALQYLLLLFLPAVPGPVRGILGFFADCAYQRGEQLGQHQQSGVVQQSPRHSLHTFVFTLGLACGAHAPRRGGQPEQHRSSGGSYLRRDTWCYFVGLTQEKSRLHFGSSSNPVRNFFWQQGKVRSRN